MNSPNKPTANASGPAPAIHWLMALVAAWGAVLAAGVYWYVDPRVMRIPPAFAALIVLLCTGAFLGFWRLMIAGQSRRLRNRMERESDGSKPALEGDER